MQSLTLSLEDPPAPAVYATVRVLDLQRLARSLRRRGERGQALAAAIAAAPQARVVAIASEIGEGPRIDYSLFGGAILVSSHLSPVWDETRLSDAAVEVIARALNVSARVAARVHELGPI